ncbi:hypothetical protein BGX26_002677, partial [Mortierella sp. AD094]
MKFQSTAILSLILSVAITNALPIAPLARRNVEVEADYGSGRQLPKMSIEQEADYGSGRQLPKMSIEQEADYGSGRQLPKM